MILLRVAIGWHLMYEGYVKITQTRMGKKPFTAEMYLRGSTGPLRFYFRGLVDDFHGLDMLDAAKVGDQWDRFVQVQVTEQALDEDAAKRINVIRAASKNSLDEYLAEKADAIAKYKGEIQKWEDEEQRPLPGWGEVEGGKFLRPPLQDLEWQSHKMAQKKLDETRNTLVAPVKGWTDDIVAAVRTEVQKKKSESSAAMAGEFAPQQSAEVAPNIPAIDWHPQLTKVNHTTMWGLAICGALMVVGLFTRLACLGGAVFLTLFYLSMPPWPGLDPAPIAEGTYLYVNKNLIEWIACLMLATSPVGVWGGLDSIIRGMITRPLFGVGKREVIDEHDL